MRMIDLLSLTASPTIVGADDAVFGLGEKRRGLFAASLTFAELNLRLSGGEKAQALTAYGSYDEGTSTLAANHIAVHLVSN